MKIFPVKLGITLGIIWGVSMFLLSIIANKYYGLPMFNSFSKLYIGCSQKTILYKIWCGILGFIDAFIGGLLIGILYNNIPINY